MSKRWRIAGVNFDHFHMGDLLWRVQEHPDCELVGICDEQPERMQNSVRDFGLSDQQVFTDSDACLEATKPDLVILCPAAARHGEWVEKVAPHGVHIMVEKPFAGSVAEADRMVAAVEKTGKRLAINWPLRWLRAQAKAHELIEQGEIGRVCEVHTYGGNRGPLFHRDGKEECEPTDEEKASSWFYSKEQGGGSLLDYLGYGATLGTWHLGNQKPLEVTCVADGPDGLEVDEQSVTIARYESGLCSFQTRWGTFSDPWVTQPQPKCGFVIKGTEGTISCYDYDEFVTMQTKDQQEAFQVEAPLLQAPFADPVQYMLHCIDNDLPIEGPLSVEVSRIGQQIVDTAFQSAQQKRTLPLVD